MQVRATAPFGFTPTASTPQGQVSGSQLAWMLAQLAPGQQQQLQVTYRVGQSGTARICANAEAAGATPVESCLTAQVTADALYIEMLGPNPEVPLLGGPDRQLSGDGDQSR